MNIEFLPKETRLRMADIASHKNRKGLTGLSENTIRSLIKAGKFPKPHSIDGVVGKFFVYGEIVQWLEAQREANA